MGYLIISSISLAVASWGLVCNVRIARISGVVRGGVPAPTAQRWVSGDGAMKLQDGVLSTPAEPVVGQPNKIIQDHDSPTHAYQANNHAVVLLRGSIVSNRTGWNEIGWLGLRRTFMT